VVIICVVVARDTVSCVVVTCSVVVAQIAGAVLFRNCENVGIDKEFNKGVLVTLSDGPGVADGTLVMIADEIVTGTVELRNMPDELVTFSEELGVAEGTLVTLAEVKVAGTVEFTDAVGTLIDASVIPLDNADELPNGGGTMIDSVKGKLVVTLTEGVGLVADAGGVIDAGTESVEFADDGGITDDAGAVGVVELPKLVGILEKAAGELGRTKHWHCR